MSAIYSHVALASSEAARGRATAEWCWESYSFRISSFFRTPFFLGKNFGLFFPLGLMISGETIIKAKNSSVYLNAKLSRAARSSLCTNARHLSKAILAPEGLKVSSRKEIHGNDCSLFPTNILTAYFPFFFWPFWPLFHVTRRTKVENDKKDNTY